MKMKTLGLAALLAGSLSATAYAVGYFPDWPVLGSAAFCGSTNSQSTSNTVPGTLPAGVCTTTVPAGPTSVTGIETLLAQTNVANGGGQANINVPIGALGAGSVQVVTANTSVVMAAGQRYLISNQSTATIALVNLPPNPVDNQLASIVNAGSGVLTLTSIAVGASPSGTTIVGGAAPATLAVQTNNSAAAAISSVEYVYRAADNKWYRLQ